MSNQRRITSRALERETRSQRTTELLTEAYATCDLRRRRELLDEVVVLNRGVAEAIAARYRGRGVPQEDLEQAAYEGLVKAVRRFDPSVRPNLLTYAVPTIRGELQRWFRDQSWMVRPPRRLQEMQWKISRSMESLSQELGHEASKSEIAHDLGCDEQEVEEALAAYGSFQATSLDRRTTETGATLGEILPDEGDDGRGAAEARAALKPVMKTLSERDRRILYLRFFEDQSQAEIGSELGVTQMQVSRLLQRILGDLRTQLV